MNTEEKEVQETEYGNWRKFEIDEDEAICVEAGYKPFNELLNEEFYELEKYCVRFVYSCLCQYK